MSNVFSFLKPYKLSIVIALFLMFVELVVELIHPLLMAKIIDDGIMEKDLGVVMFWGWIMIGLSLVAFASGIINSFFSAHVSQSFGYDVRKSLFEKVQAFSFTNFNRFPITSLITRMTNDVTQVQNTVFMSLRIMLRAPLLIIGGLVMALIVNVKLSLILLFCVPLLFIFLFQMMKKVTMFFKAVQEKLDLVNSVMRENLAGMRIIKAFLRKKHEIARFTNVSEELMNKTIRALRLIELTMPIILLVMNLAILVILWFGSIQANNGNMQVGEVVAILNYGTRVSAAFTIIIFILMHISRAKASAERISEVLTTEIDLVDSQYINETKKIEEGHLEFQHVTFQYPNTKTKVLRDISFTIKPKETVAILGATGSGKSSLFQLVPRLYDNDEGAILIDGCDTRDMKLEYLRTQIGFVPQESLLFTGTIKENIAWGKEKATMDEIVEAAMHAQIHETILSLPNQYNTRIGQKGVNLSGGQKQRISIARALIRKPKILLFDDSTSALDLKTEAKLIEALEEYSCTTLIITQKISTAMKADKIFLMEEGELIEQGTHETLLKNSSLYQNIFQSQYGKEKLPLC